MIREHVMAKNIATYMNLNKSHVSYYTKKAEQLGFVKVNFRSSFKDFELTQAGRNFLDQYHKNNKIPPICRLENIQFKAVISQMPTIPVDWHKIQMHNWVQYTSQIDSVKVRLNLGNTPTIELLPSPVDGDDPNDLFIIIVYECLNVLWDLYNRFGMKAGKLQLGSRGEWLVYDPIARAFCMNNGQVTYEGIGKVNSSKPRSIGEFEFNDPRALREYMLIPQRLKNIEIKIESILRLLDENKVPDYRNND